MFPGAVDRDDRLATKEVVLGVRGGRRVQGVSGGGALQEERVVNDVVGGEGVVVLGSGASQGARAAYLREDRIFGLLIGERRRAVGDSVGVGG